MITVILNGYKRGHNLHAQIDALKTQSVKPQRIMLWYNYGGDNFIQETGFPNDVMIAKCNYNYGVWARFYFALNSETEYVCIFDDDTIPGSRWLENCIETMKSKEGLLGTVGLRYNEPAIPELSSYFEHHTRYGWPSDGINNDYTEEVDIVGHSWFFKKEWLSYMFRELPDSKYNICGEDMHFSYMLQKYANIKTYVPPHPENDKTLWGSIHGEYGTDHVSLWESNQSGNDGSSFRFLMNEFFNNQRKKGWKLVNEKF